jgi:hypothetical protein
MPREQGWRTRRDTSAQTRGAARASAAAPRLGTAFDPSSCNTSATARCRAALPGSVEIRIRSPSSSRPASGPEPNRRWPEGQPMQPTAPHPARLPEIRGREVRGSDHRVKPSFPELAPVALPVRFFCFVPKSTRTSIATLAVGPQPVPRAAVSLVRSGEVHDAQTRIGTGHRPHQSTSSRRSACSHA